MTGHQINSLVGDLVAMAQAMERLPQVEAELAKAQQNLMHGEMANDVIRADLEQSRSYAASLEAKVHAAEASRDDAELRFLELDEKAGHAIGVLNQIMGYADSIQSQVRDAKDMIHPPQPEPIVSEVKPIAVDPTSSVSEQVPIVETQPVSGEDIAHNPPQGQSEADPTTIHGSQEPLALDTGNGTKVNEDTSGSPAPSWATPTPPKPQPYAGHNYLDWPAYVSYDKWIEGGGTHDDYYERRHPGF